MIDITIEEIKDVLHKNNYIITVQKTETGVSLKLPSAKLLKRKIETVVLVFCKKDGIFGVVKDDQFFPLEKDDLPIFLKTYLSRACEYISYAYELIQYMDKEKNIVSEEEFYELVKVY